MAVKFINPTDYASDAAYPIAAANLGTSNSGSWTYTGFARVPKNTNANYGTLLISGYDGVNASETAGVALIQLRNSSNVLSMTVTKIAPNKSNGVKFGYWDGGDGYWYIGVLSPAYRYPISVTPIMVHGNNARRVTVDNYYPWSTTAPTGWTEAGWAGLPASGAATGVSSLAAIKTQLSAWYSAQGRSSVGYYTLGLQGTISPFATSANLVVEIRASSTANYGTAILTSHNTNGGSMYLMSLNNGTWTDPKTVTLT